MQKAAAKRRILIVDDDLPYARLLIELLHGVGYEASATNSAQDAVAAVLLARPELALVNARLPGDSGMTLGATLRSEFDVPFFILSSLDDAETAQQATQVGAAAYLVKTGHMQHYLPTIHAALVRSSELRELRQREGQLSNALQQTRTISAATGVLMERLRLSRNEAFGRLRGLARAQRRRLSDVAKQFLDSVECLNGVIDAAPRRSDDGVDS